LIYDTKLVNRIDRDRVKQTQTLIHLVLGHAHKSRRRIGDLSTPTEYHKTGAWTEFDFYELIGHWAWIRSR